MLFNGKKNYYTCFGQDSDSKPGMEHVLNGSQERERIGHAFGWKRILQEIIVKIKK